MVQSHVLQATVAGKKSKELPPSKVYMYFSVGFLLRDLPQPEDVSCMGLREWERQVCIYVGVGDCDAGVTVLCHTGSQDLPFLRNTSCAASWSFPSPFLGRRSLSQDFCHHPQLGSRVLVGSSTNPAYIELPCLSVLDTFLLKWQSLGQINITREDWAQIPYPISHGLPPSRPFPSSSLFSPKSSSPNKLRHAHLSTFTLISPLKRVRIQH